ncbi:MAG: MmgE/PrpD family protein [Pseudomonadota bacterium]|nr:MmgE/PrpD family protein [Pseudomonadota bacterium]
MGITAELCDKIVATGWDDLSEEAIQRTRRIMLDGIAVAVAGTIQEEAPEILAKHVRNLGGTPTSTVINFGFKTSPVEAAYVNGAAMHVLDFEPMWQPANHQVSTTLPAVLALAEQRQSNGRDCLTAMVKGIEIMGWIREASHQDDIKTVRFHPPGLVGPLGAAIASSHMIGLDVEKLRCAVGIVASRAGSILANVGTMSKSTNCGHAVSEGVDAALLAECGFTANPDVIEHPRGYVASYFDERFKLEELLNYGPPFRVTSPGYAIKMFPSQFGTHFVITAGLDLREKIGDPARIERVKLTTPMMAYIDRPCPEDGLDGKFSWQYTTACALLDGKVVMDSFTNDRRFSDDMEAMLGRIDVEMRDDITGNFDEMYVLAEATLSDGTTVSTRCDGPRGKWGTPPIPEEDHLVKVRDCLALKYDEEDHERIIALAGKFDELSSDQIGELMALLAT